LHVCQAAIVQRDEHLAHLARDGHRMADLGRGDLDAPVPTCPDWTLGDLLLHTGQVHRWQTEAARVDRGEFPPEGSHSRGPAEGQSLADWFAEGVDLALSTMSQVEPDALRWTWAKGPGDVAQWYFRRIAQETLVHRIDAELTVGAVTDVDADLAADGIAEMCEVFIPLATGQPIGGGGETLHLHATDAESEWLLTLHDDHVDVERGHAKGDAAIRGSARDLLLMVWGREPIGAVEIFGDESVVATFTAAAKL
jgi:uncharacterized protein (TIGR03083 family)